MKRKFKTLLTIGIIGGGIILTGCSTKDQVDTIKSNETTNTTNRSITSTLDMDSLKRDLEEIEKSAYNCRWEEELEAKYGDDWDDALEVENGEAWMEQFEAKINDKINEGNIKEELISQIESDLDKMRNGDVSVRWEEELEAKYGDDWEDLMEEKHGNDWDDLFEAELRAKFPNVNI